MMKRPDQNDHREQNQSGNQATPPPSVFAQILLLEAIEAAPESFYVRRIFSCDSLFSH